MDINKQLNLMKKNAACLLIEAAPVTSSLFQVLPYITEEDIHQLVLGTPLPSNRLSDLSCLSNIRPCVLSDVIHGRLAKDFQNYTDLYQSFVTMFTASGKSPQDLDAYLTDCEPDGIFYLIHTDIRIWDTASCLICAFDEEELINPHPIYNILRGHLISTNRAFSTVIQLLDTAFRDEWAMWREFWNWH